MAASRPPPLPIRAVDAGFLVTGIEEQVGKRAEAAPAPGLEFLVHQRRRAADLRRGEALEAELGHDLLDVARGDALDVHLGDGEHHRARGTSAALQRLGVERRLAATALRDLHAQRSCGRVDLLGLVAVGVTAALRRALIGLRAEMALALDPHGEVHQRGEGRRHPVGAVLDQLFHQIGDDPIVLELHPVLLGEGKNRDGAPARAGPWPRPCRATRSAEVPDLRMHYPARL
jgi:hypothetical protein